MPLKGRQRSKYQKAQTTEMQRRRWSPKSPVLAKAIDPGSRRLLSKERKRHRREVEKVRKLNLKTRRREQRTQEKLRKAEQERQVQVEEVAEESKEQHEGQVEEWRREKEDLKKELARLKARDRREPAKIEHAVHFALRHSGDPNTVQPLVRYVKDKRGIVQDWARNTILTLVNEGIPISKTWSVTEANAKALGVTLVGKWSDHTARRVVREGGITAELMVAEYVLTCISLWLD
jgi:hypothetical protein